MTYSFKHIMSTLISFLSTAWAVCTKYFFLLVVFLAPIHQYIITVWILLFMEFLTGLWKSYKLKEPIKIDKLRMLIVMFVCYPAALGIAFQVDFTYFSTTALFFTKAIGIYVTLVEFQGSIVNLSVITGVDIWLAVKDMVTNIFNSKIKEITKSATEVDSKKEEGKDEDGK